MRYELGLIVIGTPAACLINGISTTRVNLNVSSGGSRIPPKGGGAPTYDLATFSRKLHEIERIWTPMGGGGRPSPLPLDPPMVS